MQVEKDLRTFAEEKARTRTTRPGLGREKRGLCIESQLMCTSPPPSRVTHSRQNWYLTQQALYDRSTGNRVPNPHADDGIFRTEEELWAVLGLKFLPPVLRWA